MSQKNSRKAEGINSTLKLHYEEKVRPCIDLVDSLRSYGVENDLNLPAIAVIGDQSSGKSSVLEALSGVSLPRGTGIVTRCPLVLKLKRVENGTTWSGRLSYKSKDMNLQKPEEVGTAVSNAQNALAGQGKGISHEMITLEIQSNQVPDLTLIDLPGIARVAVGDQPLDIEKQIKLLIEKFIKRQETINLVVVPANIDIATTEALQMSNKVDPNGQRTLGILTKPDLVDKGAEESVVSTVRNEIIQLKKGYMIVKCRGQKDINDQMSLAKALEKEQLFFEQHSHFRSLLDEGRATVPLLAERLTKELVDHINRSLPQLQKQIEKKLEKTEHELKELGDAVPQREAEKYNFLIMKINKFNQVLTDLTMAEEVVRYSETRLFTKIRNEFGKWKSLLDKQLITAEETLQHEIEEYLKYKRGKELPGFVNYRTFENIVKEHIKELEEPAIKLLSDIRDIVRSCVNTVVRSQFAILPNLLRAAKEPIEDLLEKEFEKGEEKVKAQFQMERSVYSQDNLYSQNLTTVKSHKPAVFRTFSADVLEMSKHLKTYFMITSDRLANQVPLIINYHMMNQYIYHLKMAMLTLIRGKNAEMLVREDSDVAKQRERLSQRFERLKKARKALVKFVASGSKLSSD